MNRDTSVELTNMCMILDGKGNVLVEEKKVNDTYGLIFPGGHIEQRESIIDSTVREIKEETGLNIKNIKLCGIKDWVEYDGSRYIVFLYSTCDFSGELKSSSEGKVYWIPLSSLKNKETLWNLNEMVEVFIREDISELFFDESKSSEKIKLK